MEFLVVTESKLKIMLTKAEMCEYGIDGAEKDVISTHIRVGLRRLLSKAKEQCGFDVGAEKVLVQFYPSKDGAEVFVTKLGSLSSASERIISGSGRVAVLSSKRSVYRFSSFENLTAATTRLDLKELAAKPRIFQSTAGEYYLIITEHTVSTDKKSAFSFIGEYSSTVPERLTCYIMEHGVELDVDSL